MEKNVKRTFERKGEKTFHKDEACLLKVVKQFTERSKQVKTTEREECKFFVLIWQSILQGYQKKS